MRTQLLSLALFCAACTGASASSTTCGSGTTLSGETCVANESAAVLLCGAGTVLSNGSCVVDPGGGPSGATQGITCASGTIVDTATKTCVATITSCGSGTQNVSGTCKAIVQVSLFAALPTIGAAVDWYAIPFSEFVQLDQNLLSSIVGSIKLGTTDRAYAQSAMTEVPLTVGEQYGIYAVEAGSSPQGVGVVLRYAYQLPFLAGDFLQGAAAPFQPYAGPQIVYLSIESPTFALNVPLPHTLVEPGHSAVTLALFGVGTPLTDYAMGLVRNGVEDPLAVTAFINSVARSAEVSVVPGDVVTIHSAAKNAGRGRTISAFTFPTGEHRLAEGKHYVCFFVNSESVCLDDSAHPGVDGLSGATTVLPDDYANVISASPSVAHRVFVNALGVNVHPIQHSTVVPHGMDYGYDPIEPGQGLITQLVAGLRYAFDLETDSITTVATFDSPTTISPMDAGFIVILPSGVANTPSAQLVPDRVGAGDNDFRYTMINGTTDVLAYKFTGQDEIFVDSHALSSTQLNTDCTSPPTHTFTRSDGVGCFMVSPCNFSPRDVLINLQAGGDATLIDYEGRSHVLVTGPC